MVNAMQQQGLEAKAVLVNDNNEIDREVYNYKPTHVVVHALWVVPSKWDVLLPRYPKIQWLVRIHSDAPFIANEGVAMDWIKQYRQVMERYKNFHFSSNSREFNAELNQIIPGLSSIYLPNIYSPSEPVPTKFPQQDEAVNISCFGALRPMKNHFMQAISAMIFAQKVNRPLRFHINSERVEQRGENVLKNLKFLFQGTPHTLVEHPWYSHEEFLEVIANMDISMQVSFSETFNIVTADALYAGVPVVVSPEISYVPFPWSSRPETSDGMVRALMLAHYFPKLNRCLSRSRLRTSNRIAWLTWNQWLHS